MTGFPKFSKFSPSFFWGSISPGDSVFPGRHSPGPNGPVGGGGD